MNFSIIASLIIGLSAVCMPATASESSKPLATVNFKCLAFKCSFPLIGCKRDHHCGKMMNELMACGNEEKCSVATILKYGDSSQSSINFLSCIRDKKCLEMNSDAPKCHLPKTFLSAHDMSNAEIFGDWFIKYGYHGKFEQWNCQALRLSQSSSTDLTSSASESDINASTSYDYTDADSSTASEQPIYEHHFDIGEGDFKSVKGKVKVTDEGFFKIHYKLKNIFENVDRLFVLYADGDYALVYRCSASEATPEYTGAFIMTRSPSDTVPVEVQRKMARALEEADVGIQSLSELSGLESSPEKCQENPLFGKAAAQERLKGLELSFDSEEDEYEEEEEEEDEQ